MTSREPRMYPVFPFRQLASIVAAILAATTREQCAQICTTGSFNVMLSQTSVAIPVKERNLTVVCPAESKDEAQAYTFASGRALAAMDTKADMYISGPRCTGAFKTGADHVLHFPYGYETLYSSSPSSKMRLTADFASLGNNVSISALQHASLKHGSNPIFIFRTSAKRFVKYRVLAIDCASLNPNKCDDGSALTGKYLVSDSSGDFAF